MQAHFLSRGGVFRRIFSTFSVECSFLKFDKNKNICSNITQHKTQYLVTLKCSCIIDGGVESTHSSKHKSVYWFNDRVSLFGSLLGSNIHFPKLLYSFISTSSFFFGLFQQTLKIHFVLFKHRSKKEDNSRSKSLKASTRENYVLTTE